VRGARSLLLAAALMAPVAAGIPAHAADKATMDEAKGAYDRGTQAYRKGDYALAAAEYSKADELMPNDVALQAALEAAVMCDDVPLGMLLLERSRRSPVTGTLANAVNTAREKFRGRAGRLRVVCGPTPCTATLDGQPVVIRAAPWVVAGRHRVTIKVGEQTEERNVEVRPEQFVEVRPSSAPSTGPAEPASSASGPPVVEWPAPPPGSTAAPAPGSSAGSSPRRGPSTWWFWGSLIVTGATGALSVMAASSAKSTHDDFDAKNCKNTASQECQDLASEGKGNQNFANFAFVLTGLGVVATAVVGIWVVRWNSTSKPAQAAVGVSPTGAMLRVSF
jgi:hypothetical protein